MGLFDSFDFSSFDDPSGINSLSGFAPGSMMDNMSAQRAGMQPPAPVDRPLDPALIPPPPGPDLSFADRFGGVPGGMAAAGGLPPTAPQVAPQVTITPPPAPPPIRPPVSPTSGAPSNADQELGAAIGGTPTAGSPMDITSTAQKAGVAAGDGTAKVPGTFDKLGKALQGVRAPEGPKPMNIGAPNLPKGGQIKTGGLQQLLQLLGGAGAGVGGVAKLGNAIQNR